MTDQAARRERRWVLLSIGTAVIGAMASGVFLAVVEDRGTDSWAMLGLVAGGMLVLVGIVFGVVFALRRRGSTWFSRSVLWELDYADRRKVLRAIRKNTPVAPEHVDIALRAAREIISKRNIIWIFVVAFVIEVVNAVIQGGYVRWLWVVAAVCFLFATAQHLLLSRRARGAVEVFERQRAEPDR